MAKQPLLGSPEMRALLLDFLDTLNGMFGRETRADRAAQSFRLATEKMFARHRRARAKQKAALSNVKRWKEHYRKRLRKFEDPDVDVDPDTSEAGADMLPGETSDEHRARLANLILFGLDWLDDAEVDWKNGEFEDYDDFLEQVQPEWLWELMETFDSNYDDAEGPTSGEPDAPLEEFPLLATGPQLFSVQWPNDDTSPLVFPEQNLPFRLKGIAVNGNVPPPGATTVDVALTIFDGAGNVFFSSQAGPTVGQGDFSLQFQIPSQLPEAGIVILPEMRCEIFFGSGGTPPAGTYSMGTSVWMLDKV